MAYPVYKYVTPEQYLELDDNSVEKFEYFKGEVVAMAGATESHGRISRNLVGELHAFLKGKSCEVFGTDYRVTTPLSDSYMYPDVVIVCGATEKKENCFDTLTNPSVIIEVLSESTSENDRGKKFLAYLQIPSLQEYILVDSLRYCVTTFKKQPDNSYMIFTTEDINASHYIHTIQLDMAMRDIYYKVAIGENSQP